MRRAVELEKKCVPEGGRSTAAPCVGVVIARDAVVMGESYRNATGGGGHAEFGLLTELECVDLSGASVFTTLEPCSRRNLPKVPCAQRLVDAGVSTVYIGLYDPNPPIYRAGWKILRDAGIVLRDFPEELRVEIRKDNDDFIAQFQAASNVHGNAVFDQSKNNGVYVIGTGEAAVFTRWSTAGHDSIHAYDDDQHVAVALHAREFDEVDDPGALDFSSRTAHISAGEIIVFRNRHAYALVRLEHALSPRHGDSHTEASIAYEVRLRDPS